MIDANISFTNTTLLNDYATCQVNLGDSAWVATSSILVMLMTPSVGFIYAGLVNHGAIGSMLGLCFTIFSVVAIIWATIGYSLVFGNSIGGVIGDMRYIGMKNLESFENKCIEQNGEALCIEKSHIGVYVEFLNYYFYFFKVNSQV